MYYRNPENNVVVSVEKVDNGYRIKYPSLATIDDTVKNKAIHCLIQNFTEEAWENQLKKFNLVQETELPEEFRDSIVIIITEQDVYLEDGESQETNLYTTFVSQ